MNIKKISVKKILDKLNFINKIDDEDDDANYARLDSFTCESDDDFNDYISVDKAYDFRDARKYDELGNLEIDSNHNYLAELAREKRIEEATA